MRIIIGNLSIRYDKLIQNAIKLTFEVEANQVDSEGSEIACCRDWGLLWQYFDSSCIVGQDASLGLNEQVIQADTYLYYINLRILLSIKI